MRHTADRKSRGSSFLNAAFGLVGSELALPIMMALVRAGEMTLSEVVGCLSVVPARLWRYERWNFEARCTCGYRGF